jgi:hypothetical protein
MGLSLEGDTMATEVAINDPKFTKEELQSLVDSTYSKYKESHHPLDKKKLFDKVVELIDVQIRFTKVGLLDSVSIPDEKSPTIHSGGGSAPTQALHYAPYNPDLGRYPIYGGSGSSGRNESPHSGDSGQIEYLTSEKQK